jgi:hypothetical protein
MTPTSYLKGGDVPVSDRGHGLSLGPVEIDTLDYGEKESQDRNEQEAGQLYVPWWKSVLGSSHLKFLNCHV